MAHLSLKQAVGLKNLIQDAVEAGVDATEDVHLNIMRQPYALLQRIPVIAKPAWAVEQVQQTITQGVYQSIRLVNRAAGTLSSKALEICYEKAASRIDGQRA